MIGSQVHDQIINIQVWPTKTCSDVINNKICTEQGLKNQLSLKTYHILTTFLMTLTTFFAQQIASNVMLYQCITILMTLMILFMALL